MKNLIFLLAILAGCFCSQAETVNSVSGELWKAFSGQPADQIRTLSVRGTVDARDFRYIADSLTNLESLDLELVVITEYSGQEALFGNYVAFDAGELPPLCFLGLPLKSIVLPQGMTEIGEGVFAGCRNLETVSLPVSLEEIRDYAFYGAGKLESLTGGSIVRIGKAAFADCRNLSAFPSSVFLKKIGAEAFARCRSLAKFPFLSGLEAIGESAFQGSGIKEANLMNCSQLKTIGAWAFADADRLEAVTLPDGVESVGDGAFFYSTSLHLAVFPNGIFRINDFLFMGSGLTSDNLLPSAVREIGDYALSDWQDVRGFVIPASVQHIGEGAFRNWTSLSTLVSLPAVPPELGDDVWEGIDKAKVSLLVPSEGEKAYKSADQWREFLFSAWEEPAENSELQVRVSGGILIVQASLGIEKAALFDINGILLSELSGCRSQAEFDLQSYSGRVYIVRCLLENGKVELIKIGRN